jgi:cysteine desulfurase/selenocysteine lyase
VWPTVVTTGWDDEKRGAARYDRLSQRAWPLVLSVKAALDFQTSIGVERIEARIRSLAALLRSRLSEIEGVRIYTSAHPALCGGLLGFTVDGFSNKDVVETLLQRHHVRVRHTDYGLNAVRASTHYYNTEEQVERLAEGLQDIRRRGVIPAPKLSD